MRVSIVVPVRDGEEFLAPTLRSALNQTTPPAEIVVVDDGSRDRSAEIARGFGAPVRLVTSPGTGACAARIAGARRADGDALMFLDADDLLGPTALEELTAALEARPGSIACCPWRRYELVDGCWLARPASCPPRRPGQDDLAAWISGWYHPPCSVLWSRAAYEASGGWDPAVASNQDGDLMMRALLAGVPLQPTAGGTAYYRRLPGDGVSLSGKRFTRTGLEARLAVLERVERLAAGSGRLAGCRAALAEAYAMLAAACGDGFGDLRARAAAGEHRTGGPRGAIARGLGRLRRRGPSAPLPSVARSAPAPDRDPPARGRPLVSVVLPTYDRVDSVRDAIASVLAQTYGDLELLVVDDASRDGTAEAVCAIGDPRLRLLRQPENRGVAAARNRGIAEARGALIAFLDSDDVWAPTKLERQVALVRRRPDRVGLFYTGLHLREDGVTKTWTPHARGAVWREMLHDNLVHFATSSVLLRQEAIEAVGGFDESLPAIEDHELWTRIARFYEIDFTPEPLITYVNEDAPSGEARRSRRFEANMRARRMYLDRYGAEAAEAGVKHRLHLEAARRHLTAPDGRAGAARLHLLKALRACPGEPRLAFWLAYALLPRGLREGSAPALRSARTRLPRRLWLGAAAGENPTRRT
jgi:glycosyltransferase involved in cell wall biosynthesis